jgi:hypothetical protein
VQPRVAVAAAQILRLPHRLRRIEPVDQVPGREVEERLARHFAALRPVVAKAECGITRSRFRRWSKSVPPMCTPLVASTSSAAVARACAVRAHAHDGEVGGAAADVDDQHQRFAA